MSNCPNCGAPIIGYKCEYCETVFDISKTEELITENELLKAKSRYLHDITTLKDMYEDAIRAMIAYACE